MRGRVPHRVKRTTNFIPAGDTSFSSLFCYAHFQSRKFGGTFCILELDFYLQDSIKNMLSGSFVFLPDSIPYFMQIGKYREIMAAHSQKL